MTEPSTSAPPAQGLFARAIGMFTSPRATYQTIVAHPKSVGIMLLTIVFLIVGQAAPQFSPAVQQTMVDKQVQAAEAGGRQMPDEQVATMGKFMSYAPYATAASILLLTPVFVMIFAGLYWLIFNVILGGTATFRQVTSIVAHSSIVGAVGAALGAPIMIAQGTYSQIGPFNLRALAMGVDADSFLSHFLGAVNVFQIWGIFVTATGLSVLYRRKAGNIAAVLILLYLGFTACMAYFFGRFMQ